MHSDQDGEYLSYKHRDLCEPYEAQLSCSAAGKPWRNGLMECWFGGFKLELGSLAKFSDIDRLHEGIAQQVFYYNTKRIHAALKMGSVAYVAKLMPTPESLDGVLQKVRG